jgi:aryl-alcohol dehydrogenase-like predicted oxidoreductase
VLTRTLGRTGLDVSIAGLGCGGPSRLGMRRGASESDAANVVAAAIDSGVTMIDTAESYGTEGAVGRAIADVDRDSLVICTKKGVRRPGPFRVTAPFTDEQWRLRRYARPMLQPAQLRTALEHSLRRLRTDRVDVYMLHAPLPDELGYCLDALVPEMLKLRDEGKLRFLGISEMFAGDLTHDMLSAALPTETFDVIMVGFHMLNQSARRSVYGPIAETRTRAGSIHASITPGTLNMFSVRRVFSDPARLRDTMRALLAAGELEPNTIDDPDDPLAWVLRDSDAATIMHAAYRFCAHEPGVDCVLTGTGNVDHLRENINAINKPPLPTHIHQRLITLLGDVVTEP